MKLILFYMVLFYATVISQTFVKQKEIGKFHSANLFSCNSNYFYVIEGNSDEILKIDTTGNLIYKIGGYGWTEDSFDFPSDIFANELNVYVADKNNNRILLYDKDLNFLNSFNSTDEYNFDYPIALELSQVGDLYILSEEVKKIFKITSSGIIDISFGGFDAGDFELENPQDFTILGSNIYVIDNNFIKTFDYYGNPINKYKSDITPTRISKHGNSTVLLERNKLYSFNKKEGVKKLFLLPVLKEIKDFLFFNEKLYVLTNNNIQVYVEKNESGN